MNEIVTTDGNDRVTLKGCVFNQPGERPRCQENEFSGSSR